MKFLEEVLTVAIQPRLKDAARTYRAWKSIVDDVQNRRMDLGTYQADQAGRAMDSADESLRQMVRETYRWLMAPGQEMYRGRMQTRWETVSVSSAAPNLIEAIENKLIEEEWVIKSWSPVHLKRVLARKSHRDVGFWGDRVKQLG